eukprot:3514141-Rhodomonas_salina.4
MVVACLRVSGTDARVCCYQAILSLLILAVVTIYVAATFREGAESKTNYRVRSTLCTRNAHDFAASTVIAYTTAVLLFRPTYHPTHFLPTVPRFPVYRPPLSYLPSYALATMSGTDLGFVPPGPNKSGTACAGTEIACAGTGIASTGTEIAYCYQGMWQRVWAAQDERALKMGGCIACVWIVIAVFLYGLFGYLPTRSLRAPYAMSGTDVAYLPLCPVLHVQY